MNLILAVRGSAKKTEVVVAARNAPEDQQCRDAGSGQEDQLLTWRNRAWRLDHAVAVFLGQWRLLVDLEHPITLPDSAAHAAPSRWRCPWPPSPWAARALCS